jgi:KaiC/GvpD/RAD55 family RecA-like ATPase
MGLKVKDYEKEKKLKFIDAYSGETGTLSGEEYSTPSPNDLTALGIQLTHCIDELGGKADVFLDSLTPILSSGSAERGLEFVRYYGARVTKSGGAFLCVATTAIESTVLSRLEEASDCVLQIERSTEVRKVVGRLLVKKARGVEHEREWVGFRITSKGRIEFVSLPSNTH